MTVRNSRIHVRFCTGASQGASRFTLSTPRRAVHERQTRMLQTAITGKTDVYLILGDPVEQVLAPETFNLVFDRMGINAVLIPVQIATADLAAFTRAAFRATNVKGFWVTIPHKAAFAKLVDCVSPVTRVAGAVNAVRRMPDGKLEGALFDGDGFMQSLAYLRIDPAGKRILVLGAGGAAAAIGTSLLFAGQAPRQIAFFDPVPGKAEEVAGRLSLISAGRVFAVAQNDPLGFDLVVNASPLGLNTGDPMPCDVTRMERHAVFIDILMKNQPTPAVRAVRARGQQAYPGFEMLIQQAPLYLEFFGFRDAAQAVRRDASFIREQIYPAQMARELREPIQTTQETFS